MSAQQQQQPQPQPQCGSQSHSPIILPHSSSVHHRNRQLSQYSVVMAVASSSALSLPSSSTLVDGKPPLHLQPPSQCVSLPALPPLPSSSSTWKSTAYCRKIARDVLAFASGGASAEVAAPAATELPEIFKTVKEAWDNVEDKYAVSSLGLAGAVALVGSTGMISAIDRLPLIPGVLEVVGIGYTGWFAYKNLIFKPDREALLRKIKDTYRDIIGTS